MIIAMWTLTEIVASIAPDKSYDSFERVCDDLRTGALAPFVESRGKTLNEAAAMLWTAVKNARRPN